MRDKKKRKYLYKLGILSEIFFENIRVLVPFGESLDPEEDEDLLSENLFELDSGKFADILEDRPLLADEDIFLGILGDEKHHEGLNHTILFGKLLDTHEHIIRELLVEREKEFFTDHLTDTRLHILIGIIILIIKQWSGWEGFFDGCEEFAKSVFVAGRYDNSILSGFSRMLEIGLGVHEDNGFLDSFQEFADFFLFLPTLSRDIDESDNHIRILEGGCGLCIDDDVELLPRFMDTRCIEEYDL